MSQTTKALWVGPFEGQMPDGTRLVPGKTVATVPKAEAERSANWQPVRSSKKTSDEESA